MREVVSMNYANHYRISITGYIPVTFWKGQLDQTPMLHLSDLCNVHGWHRGMGETIPIGVYEVEEVFPWKILA